MRANDRVTFDRMRAALVENGFMVNWSGGGWFYNHTEHDDSPVAHLKREAAAAGRRKGAYLVLKAMGVPEVELLDMDRVLADAETVLTARKEGQRIDKAHEHIRKLRTGMEQ